MWYLDLIIWWMFGITLPYYAYLMYYVCWRCLYWIRKLMALQKHLRILLLHHLRFDPLFICNNICRISWKIWNHRTFLWMKTHFLRGPSNLFSDSPIFILQTFFSLSLHRLFFTVEVVNAYNFIFFLKNL